MNVENNNLTSAPIYTFMSLPSRKPRILVSAVILNLFKCLTRLRSTYSHHDAAQTDIRTQSFSDSCAFPEDAKYPSVIKRKLLPVLPLHEHNNLPLTIPVHDLWKGCMSIGARTYDQ